MKRNFTDELICLSFQEILHVMSILDYDVSPLVDKSLQTMDLSDMERYF